MKLSRRQFVKSSSAAPLLVSDVLKSLKNWNLFENAGFDFSCTIIRPSDLLSLTYFFINLEPNSRFLKKKNKKRKGDYSGHKACKIKEEKIKL